MKTSRHFVFFAAKKMSYSHYHTFEKELTRLREKGQFRFLNTITHRNVIEADFNGKRYLNLSSNDYLGLGGNARLLSEFLETRSGDDVLDAFGLTSSSSRLLTGNTHAYDLLEEQLKQVYRREAACVFNSGYHANIGIVSAISDRHDLILSDKLNHASIMDGLKLADADFLRYRHLDYDHLEHLLQKHRDAYRRVLIISESVFSMDGDVADLTRLVALKKAYGAFLLVDEAHALGVFGKTGCGVCEEEDLVQEIDMIVGPLGKAMASLGAFAVMSQTIKEFLVNTMRPFIFTTALPPILLNWTRFLAQKIVNMEPQRQHLRELAARFRNALRQQGLHTRGTSQIIPVIIGENTTALKVSERLRERGFLVFAIRPPTVPPKTARLRLSLNAEMTWQQLETIPTIIGECLHDLSLDPART